MKRVHFIGYASGLGAGDKGCADGPVTLQETFKPLELLYPEKDIAEICTRLAKMTQKMTSEKNQFVVFAGDHSCAIGTWSGVQEAVKENIGLIWIDAHLDAHTPETTPSGNIHGMPVACLLGYGSADLIHILNKDPKIKPENLCIIGARSYEAGEHDLVKKLNIRVFYMDEINSRGLASVFAEAKQIVTKNTVGYGLSIDLDGIDPTDAPGVGTPERNGLKADEVYKNLEKYCQADPTLFGIEITEFNPHHDVDGKTVKVIEKLVHSIFGENIP